MGGGWVGGPQCRIMPLRGPTCKIARFQAGLKFPSWTECGKNFKLDWLGWAWHKIKSCLLTSFSASSDWISHMILQTLASRVVVNNHTLSIIITWLSLAGVDTPVIRAGRCFRALWVHCAVRLGLHWKREYFLFVQSETQLSGGVPQWLDRGGRGVVCLGRILRW